MSDKEEFALRTQRVLVDPAKPPQVASGFLWTRVGSAFQFEVGFFDLSVLHVAMTTPGEQDVPLYVTERYSLSKEALLGLSAAVAAMVAELARDSDDAHA